jgi:2-oxoglutarate dehydrogenase E2 component (dihydrolipoamide succinyltransferase)
MGVVNIIMPKLGESIMEATVLKWHKNVGDYIKNDETLLDIATDKVDSEVPSTAEGILEEILCNENDVIAIGSVIARIRIQVEGVEGVEEVEVVEGVEGVEKVERVEKVEEVEEVEVVEEVEELMPHVPYQPLSANVQPKNESARFYSPLVMNIASQEGLPLSLLEQIQGTGNDGRVTKKDILNYLQHRNSNGNGNGMIDLQEPLEEIHTPPTFQSVQQIQPKPLPEKLAEPVITGNVEIIEMDRMRKLISEHMTRSKATSAHVTSFAEADVTNLVLWREKNKKEFEKREGEKITFTPLFIEAIVTCIKKFPMLNSSVVGDKIIIKKDVNIGMATALPNGNLIVPVIKNADQLNIIGVTKQVNRLANSARIGKLQPTDTQDGTFTFTNVGTFGSLMGTPIINQPQVAILATGAIKKKPVVMENENGDSIAIRHMMFISMSYDHRIIDGGMGSRFLAAFVQALESFDQHRTF